MTQLAASGVRVEIDGRRILDDVALELGRGELVALLGANGSGKTTLLRVLAGLLRPDAGAVALDGEPIGGLGRRQIAQQLAIVPQFPSVELGFTALEVVLMGRAPHARGLGLAGADDLEVARRAMDELDVTHLEARPLDTLSGGERQRVVLARALAQDPRALLLDEPTTHLDLRHQADTIARVRLRCQDQGVAALVVLHEPGLAAAHADRIVLLAAGRVLAAGPPRTVLTPEVLGEAYGVPVRVEWVPGVDVPLVVPIPPVWTGN